MNYFSIISSLMACGIITVIVAVIFSTTPFDYIYEYLMIVLIAIKACVITLLILREEEENEN